MDYFVNIITQHLGKKKNCTNWRAAAVSTVFVWSYYGFPRILGNCLAFLKKGIE
jgi:hypothetical protein